MTFKTNVPAGGNPRHSPVVGDEHLGRNAGPQVPELHLESGEKLQWQQLRLSRIVVIPELHQFPIWSLHDWHLVQDHLQRRSIHDPDAITQAESHLIHFRSWLQIILPHEPAG